MFTTERLLFKNKKIKIIMRLENLNIHLIMGMFNFAAGVSGVDSPDCKILAASRITKVTKAKCL